MIHITISSLATIDEAAHAFMLALNGRTKVAFSGDMGAGKTTFIQALCRELGVKSVVNSPTFALINEYSTETGETIFHFDLYRINKISEMYDFGYEDYFYSDAYCFVEWPEKAMELIPDEFVLVHIRVNENGSRELLEMNR